jgi:hypothetical protein
MAKDVEHFFIYLLAICTFYFENCVFSSFAKGYQVIGEQEDSENK